MKTFMKRLFFASIALFLSCSSPAALTTSYGPEAARLAILIRQDVHKVAPVDTFELARHVIKLSHEYNIDPLLILAMVKVESDFKPSAHSGAGAIGLMQLMPIVIREVGSDISISKKSDLYDPYKNLHLGVHYLTYLLEKYHFNLQKALIAYNLGPTALNSKISQRNFIPVNYFKKVMISYQNYQKKMKLFPEVT